MRLPVGSRVYGISLACAHARYDQKAVKTSLRVRETQAFTRACFISAPSTFCVLHEAEIAGELQRLNCCAASACGVAIRHDVNGNVRLLFALAGHSRTNLIEEPVLKLFSGFKRASADDQSVGVKCVDHGIEEQAESAGLDAENFLAHLIAVLGQTPHELCGTVEIAHRGEFVARMVVQEKWKKTLLNRRERAERLEISKSATVTFGLDPADFLDALVRNENMAQFSAIPFSALDDIAISDDPAAQPGADNG